MGPVGTGWRDQSRTVWSGKSPVTGTSLFFQYSGYPWGIPAVTEVERGPPFVRARRFDALPTPAE